MAVQPDGKVVVAGHAGRASGGFALARYNADGSLDASFSGDGRQTTDFGGCCAQAHGVAVQPDGKVVVAGYAAEEPIGRQNVALARYNADGSLDTRFSGDGRQTTNFGGRGSGEDVAVQPDGKVVVAGYGGRAGDDFALARYNADGSLDRSFSGDGRQTTAFGRCCAQANGVAVQPDRKVVVAGYATEEPSGRENVALARYNADGSLDTRFSGDGRQTTAYGGRGFDSGEDVAVQPDGKVVVAGAAYDEASARFDFALARYNADGSLDRSFSGDGKQTTDLGDVDFGEGVVLQPDGRIVVAGSSFEGVARGEDFALARYNADGSLDTSFSGDGRQTTDFAGAYEGASGVVLQPDGKVVVAGEVGGDFGLARYLGAPGPVCAVTGSSRNDVLVGPPHNDVICAGAGNDVVRAGGGNDTVYGGRGNDVLRADGGSDRLYGQGGNDALTTSDGRRGNDSADGGGGNDACSRDPGDRHRSCSGR